MQRKLLVDLCLGKFHSPFPPIVKQHLRRQDGLSMWLNGKEPACQCKRCRFDPWVRKPWRRKWQLTSVFFLKVYMYLFIYLYFCVPVCAEAVTEGSSLAAAGGDTLRHSAEASHCSGVSCGAQALGALTSAAAACRHRGCGACALGVQAQWP